MMRKPRRTPEQEWAERYRELATTLDSERRDAQMRLTDLHHRLHMAEKEGRFWAGIAFVMSIFAVSFATALFNMGGTNV